MSKKRKSENMDSVMWKIFIGVIIVSALIVCYGLFFKKDKPVDITDNSVTGTWYSEAKDTYYSWQDGKFYYQDPGMREKEDMIQWDYDIMLHKDGKMMLTYYNPKNGETINSFEMRFDAESKTLTFLDEEGAVVDTMTPYVEEETEE